MLMISYILNLLFPEKCIFCGQMLSYKEKRAVCSECNKRIPFTPDVIYQMGEEFYFDEAICLSYYSGIVKDAIKRFKFQKKPGYYRAFGKLMAEKIKKVTSVSNFDIIISVPLHKDKYAVRGYNQAHLISSFLSKELGIKEKSYVISRVKNTKVQSLLSRDERNLNIKDAFKVLKPNEVYGKSVLIIDDVLTTGGTLSECSMVLKEAGAIKVTALVIASGKNFSIPNGG